jgi:hypothetical protein
MCVDNLCIVLRNTISEPEIYVHDIGLALTNESGNFIMSLMYMSRVIIQGDHCDTREHALTGLRNRLERMMPLEMKH